MGVGIQYPRETAVFSREGEYSLLLKGRWSRFHDEKQMKETWTYKEDGSYIGFWGEGAGEHYPFGFYVDEGGKIKTAEFRADVRTEGDIFISKTLEGESSNGYIFETTDVCKFFNLSTNQLVFTFTRKM